MRATVIAILVSMLAFGPAQAQMPGQMPGTLPAAPPVPTPPPPPVAPPPVPSVVTPLRTPSYGVPPGVTYPTTGITPTYTYRVPPKKRIKKKRRPRTSEIAIVRPV